jgi:hypothetical protein
VASDISISYGKNHYYEANKKDNMVEKKFVCYETNTNFKSYPYFVFDLSPYSNKV